MKARHVDDLEDVFDKFEYDLERGVRRGDFEVTQEPGGQRWFWFVCPGCATLSALAIRPTQLAKPSWELSGTEDAPTLSPSINHVGCWHGWLRAGEFTVA